MVSESDSWSSSDSQAGAPGFQVLRIRPLDFHWTPLEEHLQATAFSSLVLAPNLSALLGARYSGAFLLLCLGSGYSFSTLAATSRHSHRCLVFLLELTP